MKKNFALIIAIALIVILFVTNISEYTEEDMKLVNSVRRYEKNDYQLKYYEIGYEKYKENLQDIVTNNFPYKDDDWVKDHKALEGKASDSYFPDNNYITVHTSRVFEISDKEKLVYSVAVIDEEDDMKLETKRKYFFKKINGSWKINEVKGISLTYEGVQVFHRSFVDEELELMKTVATNPNGEPVEYTEKVVLSKLR